MITDTGKHILATYLAGLSQMPLQYLALGCGAKPELYPVEEDFADQTKLSFESIRIPVTETAVVEEGGETYVSLSAPLPSEQRYEFSEIGVYSKERDLVTSGPEDQTIFSFSDAEGWLRIDGSGETQAIETPIIIDNGAGEFSPNPALGSELCFFVDSDNEYFLYSSRPYQTSRYYVDALMVRGDLSTITGTLGSFAPSGEYVRANKSLNFEGIRVEDQISVALAILPKNLSDLTTPPDGFKMVIELRQNEASDQYARLEIDSSAGTGFDFANNGYYAISASLSGADQGTSLKTSANFSWSNIGSIAVYLEVDPGGALSSEDYYVLLDGLRFSKSASTDPNYGLVAYSIVQNASSAVIKKEDGKSGRIVYKVKVGSE